MGSPIIESAVGRPSNLQERLNNLNQRGTTPMACAVCGGKWFFKVTVEQFADGGYGSAQFRSLTMAPETAYVCLCGQVLEINESVGRGVATQHGQFISTLKDISTLQKKNTLQEVASQCASLTEFNALVEKVKWLEDAVDILSQQDGPEGVPGDHETEQAGTGEEEALDSEEQVIAPAPAVEQMSAPVRTGRKKASK